MIRTLLVALSLAPTASAATLRVLPGHFTLTGQYATQRVTVVEEAAGDVRADRTALATFTSSAATVASVDRSGNVRAESDGEAVITAKVGEQAASITVRVEKTREPFAWSFRNHVTPVLTRAGCNSGACHGALAGKGGMKLSLRGYDLDADHFVLTRQALGRRVDREAPAKSLVLLKPTMAVVHGGGQKIDIDTPEYRVLANWVADGAPGPTDKDARIQRIEVSPPSALLAPKDAVQLLVRAYYSDGTSQDVTRWAKYSSAEDLVAGVNLDGKVTVTGHGEAAISVWYSNRVASATIVSPYANKLAADVYSKAVRFNFVDELVLKKLARVNLPPSPLCDDHEFVRRAFLDTAGILPTPEEVRQFVLDASHDKRAKLIDALLERPEYVDYWAYKWSDMLLITTRRLSQTAVWGFYQHVRQGVADNKPWDRFARDILTASGSNLRNGAANYFVLHKDVTAMNEATAVTFLGMSLTCARCHNHPLERWTQDQYWQMANFFGRVGLKDDDRGAILVQPQPTGEAVHPRRGVGLEPTPLDGKPLSLDHAGDRRKYLVDWLTAADNPYFAKALVNRVWRNYLGRGLVEAEDDLRETNPPTNAELFDALAKDFVNHKYDVKHLIRTIMTSTTYQRTSRPVPGNEADDRFYSRYLARRLSGEVILDAYSQVTGVPTPFKELMTNARDATTPYGGFPLGTRALQLPDSLVASRFLDAFGRPERANTCSCERSQDSTVGQALHLSNGETLNAKLRSKESVVARWLADKLSDDEVVRRLYRAALCREPTAKELATFGKQLSEVPAEGRREALEDLVWAVLTSKEFVFNR